MWFIVLFICIFIAIHSDSLREDLGWFVWTQWLLVGGLVLYMVLSWIF